jgi:hypothetical protein
MVPTVIFLVSLLDFPSVSTSCFRLTKTNQVQPIIANINCIQPANIDPA